MSKPTQLEIHLLTYHHTAMMRYIYGCCQTHSR